MTRGRMTPLLALLALLLPTTVGAQTPPPEQRITFPISAWFLWWSHTKVDLHHFELKVDTSEFTEVVPIETSPGRFRHPFPALAPGQHTLTVRACPATASTTLACSEGAQIVATLAVMVEDPTEFRAGKSQ